MELIRYIHLNPLRAKLAEDLKALDKYPWTGHSVLLGNKKNPLVPEIPPAIGEDKFLAEKTVEDVLRHFGENLKEARRRYRQFVEKGIKHGRREDLQGGGLIRGSGGDKTVLLGQKKEDREKSDQRILGSGGFVGAVLQKSERLLEKKYKPKQTIDDLIAVVAGKVGVSPELICSRSRQRKYSEARAVFSYLAVEETGYPAADVARYLGVKRMSVHEAVTRGKALCARHALLGQERE